MTPMTDPLTMSPPATADDAVVRTDGLTRYFGRTCAVDGVTLSVHRGSVLALLGRNGSGKSTLVRMLLGMLPPTRGSASVLGDDCRRLRPVTRGRVGYVAEGHPLVDWMRVSDLVAFQRGHYPGWAPQVFDAVVGHFGLTGRSRAGDLSRGQRAGLSLALVLATRPDLLVMDDPALGLDPVARRTLLEAMILVTRDAGHTILFTSHELADVERVADHIAVMDGSVLRVAAPVDAFRARVRRVALAFGGGAPPGLLLVPGLLHARRDGDGVVLTLVSGGDTDPAIARLGATSARDLPLSLEEAVVAYLGHRDGRPSLLQQEGLR